MMGKTHYTLGVLYYILVSMLTNIIAIPLLNYRITLVGLMAAAIGAIFPDADSDHSLINSRNPIFKTSNRTINAGNKLLKKLYVFILFGVPGGFLFIYMYKNNSFTQDLIAIDIVLFILAFTGVKVGRKIYIPILSGGLKAIDRGTLKLKKMIMLLVYIGLGVASIYFSKGSIIGIIWGIIFIIIAVFPHRSFLHAPEGLIITVLGVKYLEGIINIGGITIPFFIGYFSHLYLADIFTVSGVPISSIPLILRKVKIHNLFKKNRFYKAIYNLLNKKLCIPLIKTGSKTGGLAEGLYVFALLSLIIITFLK